MTTADAAHDGATTDLLDDDDVIPEADTPSGRVEDAPSRPHPFADLPLEADGMPSSEALRNALRAVIDPEIGYNIVDLGLVYSLETKERLEGGYKIDMDMTLTAPGCGMGPAIAEDAKGQLERVPGVSEAEVNIVWDPPWNQDMITEEGKMVLGLV